MRMRTLYFFLAALFLSINCSSVTAEEYYEESYSSADNEEAFREAEPEFYNSPDEISGYENAPVQEAYYDSPAAEEYYDKPVRKPPKHHEQHYSSEKISSYGEKVIIVDPHRHTWSAYSADGNLIRSGLATAGASWCHDIGRPCRTRSGVFRIYSLGDSSCVSRKYPVGEGGAPMPYCMYFNGGQGLHGSHELARANISHGCVRISVGDARWLRYHFAGYGTKVIIKSY